jgi:hypothetical protein
MLVKTAFFAPRSGRSEAQSLDWPPALRTLASGRMGDPVPVSLEFFPHFLSVRLLPHGYSTTEAQRCASWSLSRSRATRAFCFLTSSTIPSNPSCVIACPFASGPRRLTNSSRHAVISTISALGRRPVWSWSISRSTSPADQLRLGLHPLRRQRMHHD